MCQLGLAGNLPRSAPHPRFLVSSWLSTSARPSHLLRYAPSASFSSPFHPSVPFPSLLLTHPLGIPPSRGSSRSGHASPVLWTLLLPVASNTDTFHLPPIHFAFFLRAIPGIITREASLAFQLKSSVLTIALHFFPSAPNTVFLCTSASPQHQTPPHRSPSTSTFCGNLWCT